MTTPHWTLPLGKDGPVVEAIFDAKTGTAEIVNLDDRLKGEVLQRVGTFEEITSQFHNLTRFAVRKGWFNKNQASHWRGKVDCWYDEEIDYRQRRYGR